MITLNELKAGENAEILGIEADKDVKERLKMLGIFPGARVCF
ncbi:MAG: FeoA family protein [Christensenellaceae bacterium]